MTLQITKQNKKGGPYNKAQQEQRRIQVYEMYFEKGYTAIQISSELNINRNTVNDDIKYWYSQMAEQIGDNNLGVVLLKQIERIEIQRKRLLDELEQQTDFEKRYRLERLLFEIDQKIATFVLKIAGTKILSKIDTTEEISQDEISGLIRSIAFSCNQMYPESISEDSILTCIISMKKCDIEYAKNVFYSMRKLGLNLFADYENYPPSYDILSFGITRGFIKQKENDEFFEKRKKDEKKEKLRLDEMQKKYEKMYGSDQSKWSLEIREKMDDEIDNED